MKSTTDPEYVQVSAGFLSTSSSLVVCGRTFYPTAFHRRLIPTQTLVLEF